MYIKQPQGFKTDDQEDYVCRLKKALYGLKQAPRAWYGRIDGFLMSLGFIKSKEYSNLYYKVENDGIMILPLYVDDLCLIGEDKLMIECKKNMAAEFEMKYLGMMHYFIGLEAWQYLDEIFLNLGNYVI